MNLIFLATQSNYIFPIKQAAWLLGFIMEAIFNVLDKFGIGNIGLSIILFTIIVNVLMIPMTIKQQKYAKMNAVMMPEIKAIQDKYKNRTNDQDAMMKQNSEVQAVYEKYGTSPTGSCLQLLIQMPILFGLYQVIYKIPGYVGAVKSVYLEIIEKVTASIGTDEALMQKFIEFYNTNYPLSSKANHVIDEIADLSNTDIQNYIVDMLYTLKIDQWEVLVETFGIDIAENLERINNMNNFLWINLSQTPQHYIMNFKDYALPALIVAIAIPILSMVTQIISTKLSSAMNGNNNAAKDSSSENPTEQSMKMMNNIMPFMSLAICFSLPAGLGVYWVASSVVRVIIQLCINAYLSRMDMEELVKKNIEKANEKRAKRGLPPNQVSSVATANIKNLQNPQYQAEMNEKAKKKQEERERRIKEANEYYQSKSGKKSGLSSKANMVQQYNEKNDKK